MGEEVVDRSAVEARWLAIVEGRLSREKVHAWANLLVRGGAGVVDDVLTRSALQYLHGFDLVRSGEDAFGLSHGGPGAYVKALKQVADELEQWREHCAAYDRDPQGWVRARVQAARDASTAESI